MYRILIRTLQYISVSMMWFFGIGVVIFVPWLVIVANRWRDAPNWSLVISIVMIPVFLTLASVLSYVFFGLRRGLRRDRGGDLGG